MVARIVIESSGDHSFDLMHLRREGGEELVRLLLREAGYDDFFWRLRVDKKFACGAETRPVTVVGSKPWCCYLKIKPGDNNSGHSCSLIMPNGLRGDLVYEALKAAGDRIDRNWRNGRREIAAEPALANGTPEATLREIVADADQEAVAPSEEAAAPAAPAAPGEAVAPEAAAVADEVLGPDDAAALADGDSAAKTTLKKWCKDPEKIRLTLLAIHEIQHTRPSLARNDFVEALADSLGWEGVSRHQIGGIFTTLVRNGTLVEVREGHKKLGYALTEKSTRLIEDLLAVQQQEAPAPLPPAPVSADSVPMLASVTQLSEQLADICRKLHTNRARRAELEMEMQHLDAEARELGSLLDNDELRVLLQRFSQVTKDRPPLSGAGGSPRAST